MYPPVSLLGLSYVLDAFAKRQPRGLESGFPLQLPPKIKQDEIILRESRASSGLRAWCRGLVEVIVSERTETERCSVLK